MPTVMATHEYWPSQIHQVELVHQIVEFVFRLGRFSYLTQRHSDRCADRVATDQEQLLIPLFDRHINRPFALLRRTKQLR